MSAASATHSVAQPTHTVKIVNGCCLSVGDGRTDERIGAVTAAQRGRAHRQQLIDAGIHPRAIDRRLRNGRLVHEHPSVYMAVADFDVPLGPETAAVLACGPDAALSGHSAATLWTIRPGEARPIHVTIPAGRHPPRLEGVVVHRSRTLTSADVRIHRDLPVTSPERALLDTAARLDDRDVELLLAVALDKRLTTPVAVRRLLARAGRHAGAARLARVLARAVSSPGVGRTESNPEKALLGLIRAARLQEPETQVWRLDYRLDFFWPAKRLAVEVDTYGTHGSQVRFERDRLRDARLLAEAGITVIRVTDVQIEREPLVVIALLARALTR